MRLFNRLAPRRQGKWEETIMEYKHALEINLRGDTIHYNMGMAYIEADRFRNAFKCMEKALSLNPELPWASAGVAYNLGLVMFKNARRDEAKRCFEAALEQNPKFDSAKGTLEKL